ncbi:MAG: N-acetylmuramic acid 6-phosphate etherase [Alphaproteobacteria bacterium]|nr:N-acetylmuramic acid 6-phosphate etherase [Alphaproteobacteria bacterium]
MSQPQRKTEQVNPVSTGIDTWPDAQVLGALLDGQVHAVLALKPALPALARAADAVATRLRGGGTLYYAGAGTSVRIAVQDGTELPATYGIPEAQLGYLIAGGKDAIFETLADKEDSAIDGAAAAQPCGPADVLIAVAASGRTPYTIAAAEMARTKGCFVISVVNVAGSALGKLADVEVVLDTGPEVIAGSTRMGAGTAQKAALNLISTLACIKLGGVHDGMMVAMRAENEKLKERAAVIVSDIAGVSLADARGALADAHEIKPAILLCAGAKSLADANALLSGTKGNLRLALAQLHKKT